MSDELELASRWRRLVATIIDAILVPALSFFLVMAFGVVEHAEDFSDRWWVLHVLLLAIASYLLLNGVGLWRRGQTIGKWCLGIAVVSAQATSSGNTGPQGLVPAPWWKLVLIRAWFFALLFVPLFALAAAPWLVALPLADQLPIFGRERRCLHDRFCGTRVIRAR